MAAYAVIARIGRAEPHLVLGDLDRDLDADDGPDGMLAVDVPVLAADVIRADEPDRLAEWLSRARELWKQTTFYVFDADSWRT
jgi:hypothetical protein